MSFPRSARTALATDAAHGVALRVLLLLAVGAALLVVFAPAVTAQCYGGPCEQGAHQSGQVSWFDAVLSNSGWGEGPPCNSCHTTSRVVERPRRSEPPRTNFPQQMDQRRYLDFHSQAVRLTRGKGPIETLELRRVDRRHQQQWRWVNEAPPKKR